MTGQESDWRRQWPPLDCLFIGLAVLLCPAIINGAISCPELTDKECLCDIRKGTNQRGGWEISCPTYRIEYEIRSFLKLECTEFGQDPPYEPAMFGKYNLTNVDYIQMIMCALPDNVTLSQVLDGVPVKKLKFEGDMPGIHFENFTFQGLDSLLSLNLGKNQLEELPEDLLSNLTLLRSVDLNENNLKSLPESLFRDLTELVSIQLGGNELQELPPGIFANLTKLKRLYLYKNRLQELPDGIFVGLKSLEVLDLANNRIRELHPELFLDTPQLLDLNIRVNNLTRLQSDLLQGTKHLRFLDLSDNRLTKLPENLLDGLKALRKISLNNCNLKGIGEAFFSHAANLTKISMNNNRLTYIPPELFEKNLKLEEIVVRYNDILELPSTVFDKNFYLRTLVITHNNLTSLPSGILDHLSNLEVLDLTGNALTSLNKNLLSQNQKLVELYVAKNKLTDLRGNQPFGESSQLKIVDLSENQITSLSDGINWAIYLKLEKVDLRNNNVTLLSVPDILSVRTEIDLTNNQIRLVKLEHVVLLEKTQKDVTRSLVVDLQGNPLSCDCNLLNFYDYATDRRSKRMVEFRDLEDLQCMEPASVSGMKLTDMEREDFLCSVTEGCPWRCKCTERASDRAIIVNCSHISDLPDTLPAGTTEVHLEDNRIENLNALEMEVWDNVTSLFLDRNNITVGDWRLPANLTVLSLKTNQLEYLPQWFMDYVDENPNIRVNLSGNPWLCDCQTLHMRDWLTEKKTGEKVKDRDEMHCSHPVWQNGSEIWTTVMKLRDDICPVDDISNEGNLITVSLICVVLAVMLFVVSVLYYRNKQTVIAYFYIHFHNVFVCFFNDEDLDEDKTFDAFVSYSSADRDVAMELLNQLENGDPSFKLCIHERDWLPGNLISWNIVNSVQNSRKTILVLSKHFLESVWFQVEFHTAYYQMLEDRIDRLIVVVRGDLPEKGTLDKDLQCLLSTKTFLQWGERWFWEKLRYALPHRKGTGKPGATPKVPPLQDKSFPLRQRPNAGLLRTVEEKIATLSGDSIFSTKRTESARNADSPVPNAAPQDSVPVSSVSVNATKAQSRRFNGARTQNAPQLGDTHLEAIPA